MKVWNIGIKCKWIVIHCDDARLRFLFLLLSFCWMLILSEGGAHLIKMSIHHKWFWFFDLKHAQNKLNYNGPFCFLRWNVFLGQLSIDSKFYHFYELIIECIKNETCSYSSFPNFLLARCQYFWADSICITFCSQLCGFNLNTCYRAVILFV